MDEILNEVMTAAEAAELWSLDASTIKKACLDGRIECRKSKGTWLVARAGLEKLYGQQKNSPQDS